MNEQHRIALAERRLKSIAQSTRLVWIVTDFQGYVFNIGIQVGNNRDLDKLSELDTSNIVDKISSDVVLSNKLDLIAFSDELFQHVSELYQDHGIVIDVVYENQPVLSNTYNFNNPPF